MLAAVALALGVIPPGGVAQADEHEDEDEEEEVFYDAYQRDYVFGAPENPTEEWALSYGGRLYDSWFEALGVDPPEETHPAYPAGGREQGAATWRCKECHGWDYKGAEGVYGEGSSRYTGIPGIHHLAGTEAAEIAALIRGEPHGFTAEIIPEEALGRLAQFISRGLHDTDEHVERGTGAVKDADVARGQRVFQNVCAACHGFDGRALDFADGDEVEYIGTVASDNPWEVLHKVRNGQPGAPMPAMRPFDMSLAVDILAFAGTLPPE